MCHFLSTSTLLYSLHLHSCATISVCSFFTGCHSLQYAVFVLLGMPNVNDQLYKERENLYVSTLLSSSLFAHLKKLTKSPTLSHSGNKNVWTDWCSKWISEILLSSLSGQNPSHLVIPSHPISFSGIALTRQVVLVRDGSKETVLKVTRT